MWARLGLGIGLVLGTGAAWGQGATRYVPDDLVVTGPNNQQVPLGNLWVNSGSGAGGKLSSLLGGGAG